MTPWRDTWKESDPKRACWGCGASPTSRYTNGSPRYSCGPHPVGVLTPEELAHLGARRWKAGDTVDMGPLHTLDPGRTRKFGGVEYLQPRLDRAMQSGWGPVAAEVTEQRRAKERH